MLRQPRVKTVLNLLNRLGQRLGRRSGLLRSRRSTRRKTGRHPTTEHRIEGWNAGSIHCSNNGESSRIRRTLAEPIRNPLRCPGVASQTLPTTSRVQIFEKSLCSAHRGTRTNCAYQTRLNTIIHARRLYGVELKGSPIGMCRPQMFVIVWQPRVLPVRPPSMNSMVRKKIS